MPKVKKKKMNSPLYSIGYHFGGNKSMMLPWEMGKKGAVIFWMEKDYELLLSARGRFGDFPSHLVVQTPRFHCKEHGSNPWSGNQDLAKLKTWPKEKKERVGLVSSTVGVPGLKEVLRG